LILGAFTKEISQTNNHQKPNIENSVIIIMVKDPDLKPLHPGEILKSEFLEPLNMKGEELAKNIQVKKSVIRELLDEKRRMTVDLAYRLYFYFGVSAEY